MKHRAYERMKAAFATSDGGWLKRTDLALLLGRRYVGTITDVLILNKMQRDKLIQIKTVRVKESKWFEYRRVTVSKYDRSIAVYNFILRYYADTGFMPTVNEIVHGTPYRSTSSTVYALKLLAIWKWIKHEPTTKRVITLIRPTERGMSAAELKAMLER